jgi:hypothetical protein
MRHFWFARTTPPAVMMLRPSTVPDGAYYAIGIGDVEVIHITGESEMQAQQWAMICARALNAHEAELHRTAAKDDE